MSRGIPLGPCTCADFAPNVKLINAPFMLAAARNPDTYTGYQGKEFKFCPWCGEALSCLEFVVRSAQNAVEYGKMEKLS